VRIHGIRCKEDTDMGFRRASEESILAVQIFDQKKFKKKDQGFLGVINVRVGDVVDFSSGQDRE
jgi:E3 ubiquitin-protein ligase NEDD4